MTVIASRLVARAAGTLGALGLLLLALMAQTSPAAAQAHDEQAFQLAERLYRDGLFELAGEQFTQFAADHPSSQRQGEALLLAADCLIQLDRLEDALAAYERVAKRLRQGPLGCEAAYKRGEILAEIGRHREALRAFDATKGSFPDCERRYDAEVGAAEALIELGRPDEALGRLADLPGDPERPGTLARTAFVRARALQAAGETANALAAHEAVIQLFPSTIWEDRSHLGRARLLAGEGFHAEALEELDHVGARGRDESAPVGFEAGTLRAGILERLGRHREAAVALEAAAGLLTAEPARLEQVLARAAMAYERAGEPAAALAALERSPAPATDPALAMRTMLARARLAHGLGRDQPARQALGELRRLAAGDTLAAPVRALADSLQVAALLLEVDIEAAAGRPGEGGRRLRAWDRTGHSPAERARVDERLGDLELVDLERPLEARGAYRSALAAWDELGEAAPPRLHIRLGEAEEALGRYAAAREAYEAAHVGRPRHARSREAAARAAYVRDYLEVDLDRAAAELAAIAADGARGRAEPAVLLRRLADVQYEHRKDYPAALELYEELLAMAAAGGAEAAPAGDAAGAGEGGELAAADAAGAPEAAPPGTATVLYRAGRAAILAAHRPGKKPDAALVERGHRHFLRLSTEFPEDPRADDARLALIAAQFGPSDRDRHGDRQLTSEAKAYQIFLEEFPGSDQRHRVLFSLGVIYRDAAEAAGGDSTSYAVARDYFAAVMRDHAESDVAPDAAYWRAVVAERLGEQLAAASGFQDYLRLFPAGVWAAECHYRLGELALADRRVGDARGHYRWILGGDREHKLWPRALARLGDCELLDGNSVAAIEHYEKLVEHDRHGPLADQAVLRLAEVHERERAWGRAEAALRRHLAEYPDSPRRPEAHLRLGRLRARRGDHQGAADALEHYLASGPPAAEARAVRFERAQALTAAGRGEQALDAYRQLWEEARTDTLAAADAMRARAEAVMLLYDLDREKDARKAAAGFATDFPDAVDWQLEIEIARGNHLLRHDAAAARRLFEELLETHGGSESADRMIYGLGLTELRSQDFAAAATHFERLTRRHPDSPLLFDAHFKLGTCYYTLERYDDAAHHYGRAHALAPAAAAAAAGDARRNQGLAYERAGRFADAIRLYRDMRRDYAEAPLGLHAAFKIGFCYQEWGKYQQAIAAYREVLPRQTGTDAAETQFWIAECHEIGGQLERAAGEYLKVGYLYPDSGMWAGTARYRAGEVYEQLGRTEDAQAVYTALAREDAGGEWGGRATEKLRLLSQDSN